jgi:hypothetical protein
MFALTTLLAYTSLLEATALDFDSVEAANANRARIIAAVNGDPRSTWTAGAPIARFRDTPYSVLRSLAGVLGGDPTENEANLPVKTLAEITARYEARYGTGTPPASFDAVLNWPQCPIIGEIRDQSACGSCYAVSGASAATDRFCIASNGAKQDRLSATDLMSCCKTCAGANGGCFGGTPSKCWDYISTQGIAKGGSYGDFSKCLEVRGAGRADSHSLHAACNRPIRSVSLDCNSTAILPARRCRSTRSRRATTTTTAPRPSARHSRTWRPPAGGPATPIPPARPRTAQTTRPRTPCKH